MKSLCPILTAAEGFILGVGAKMFTIAEPGIVYGLLYWNSPDGLCHNLFHGR